jgi:hypothetical protein
MDAVVKRKIPSPWNVGLGRVLMVVVKFITCWRY